MTNNCSREKREDHHRPGPFSQTVKVARDIQVCGRYRSKSRSRACCHTLGRRKITFAGMFKFLRVASISTSALVSIVHETLEISRSLLLTQDKRDDFCHMLAIICDTCQELDALIHFRNLIYLGRYIDRTIISFLPFFFSKKQLVLVAQVFIKNNVELFFVLLNPNERQE